MKGAHFVIRLEAEAMKLGRQSLRHRSLGLIGDQQDRQVRLAQLLRDIEIAGDQSRFGIHHEQQHIGARRLLERTRFHLVDQRIIDAGEQSAGVDELEGPAGPFDGPALHVARDARRLVHERTPSPRQAIEERGLAHVGASHHGDDGRFFHDDAPDAA